MIAEKLRKAVIMAAMQGKLTQQSIVDGDSNDYFDKSFFVKENEQLFDIPGNWAWFRLGSILTTVMGQSPKSESVNSSSGLEFHQGKVAFTEFLISHSGKYCTNPTKIASKNSVLLCVRAPVGIVNYTDRELCIGRGLVSVEGNDKVDVLYIYRYLETMKEYYEKKSTGSTFKAITSKVINNTPFALPPIEEQKRIVEKLEVLLAEINKLEEDEKALKDLEDKFPEKLKTSILKSAMEGKLTNQLLNDSKTIITIDKKYAQIQQEQIPYTIPENWKWFRVKELFVIRNGFTPLRSNMDFWNSKDVPWFTVNDIRNQGRVITYTDQYISNLAVTDNKVVPKNSILLCCTASIGEYALTKIDLTTNQQFNGMTIKDKYQEFIDIWFVYYWVQTIKEEMISKAGKTTFPFLSVTKLGDFLIPLPPIEEQKRIVEKLDKLFAVDLLNI